MPKESIASAEENRHYSLGRDSRKVEFKVKLPGVDAGRIFSFLICESQAQLDNFQKVNITPKELILIVYGTAEFTNWPYNNSRKLCVLGEKGKSYFTTYSIRSRYYYSIRSLFSSTLAGVTTAFYEFFCKFTFFFLTPFPYSYSF